MQSGDSLRNFFWRYLTCTSPLVNAGEYNCFAITHVVTDFFLLIIHQLRDARTPVTLLKHSPWGFIEEAGSGAPLGDRGMRILVVFNNWNQELSLFGKRNRLRQRELLQISCQHWFQHWFWSLNVIYSVVLRCYISFVSVNLWFWANVSPFLWLLLVELWNQLLHPPSF